MKTLIAVLAAFLVSAGLLVVSAPANAAYPKSVATTCALTAVQSTFTSGTTPRAYFKANPTAGSGTPTGALTVKIAKNGVTVRTVTGSYAGGLKIIGFKPLSKGSYTARATLTTSTNSVYKGCSDNTSFKVA